MGRANRLAASLLGQDQTRFWSRIKRELGGVPLCLRALVEAMGVLSFLQCGRITLKRFSTMLAVLVAVSFWNSWSGNQSLTSLI